MSCDIQFDENSYIDDYLATAANDFAVAISSQIPNENFHVKLGEPDSQGWQAYIRGREGYAEELCAMVGSGWYHFEDTYYLSDEDCETFKELVHIFASAISENGEAKRL